LRIALSKQLGDPFISDAARTKSGCVGGAEIIDPEIKNPRFLQRCAPDFFQRFLVTIRVFGVWKQIIAWSSQVDLAPKRIESDRG
jgi:hypothetical protein